MERTFIVFSRSFKDRILNYKVNLIINWNFTLMSSQISAGLVYSVSSSVPNSNQPQIIKPQSALNRSRSNSPNSASDTEPPVSALSTTLQSHHSLSTDGHLDIDQLRIKLSETKHKIAIREQKEQGISYEIFLFV